MCVYSEINQYMILVNVFQVAMLEEKQSFALTLFTCCFLKCLWYIKTLTSQISCCWLLQHFDYNHLMSYDQQVVIVCAYITVCLFFKSCFLRFYTSCTSYLWRENAVALIGKKGFSKYHCTIRTLAVLPFFTTLAWDFTVTVHKLQHTSAGKKPIL